MKSPQALSQNIFKKLMNDIEPLEITDDNILSYKSVVDDYTLEFYTDLDNRDYEFTIEHCGRFINNKWQTLRPTTKQLEAMDVVLKGAYDKYMDKQDQLRQEALDARWEAMEESKHETLMP